MTAARAITTPLVAAILKPRWGAGLKALRLRRGLGQKKWGPLLGVDPSFISLLENDRRVPSVDLLDRIAGVLDMRVSEVVAFCEEVPP